MVDLIDEVNEDLRRERFTRLWQKVGVYVVAASVVIVVATVGSVVWKNYRESRQTEAAQAFLEAEKASRAQNNKEAAQKFAEVAKLNAQGFTPLAQMREAYALTKAGVMDQALAAYNNVVADNGADAGLRALARIHAAALMSDTGKPAAEIKAVLDPLVQDKENPFSAFAREQLAYAALQEGNAAEAHRLLAELTADSNAPASLRRRTQAQLPLVAEKAGIAGNAAQDNEQGNGQGGEQAAAQ